MPSLASVEQLGTRLGVTLAGADAERAAAVLDDASALVRAEAGIDWLNEAGDGLEDVPAVVEAVVLQVAYRAYRNPDGVSQSSVGDVSVSYSRTGGTGAVYLTRDERRSVRGAAGRSLAGSVELTSPYTLADPYYAPAEGDAIPLGPLPWRDY